MAMVLAAFLLIALIDLTPIIRQRSGREAAAFLLVFSAALILSILLAAGVEIPSAMLVLDDAFKAMGLSY